MMCLRSQALHHINVTVNQLSADGCQWFAKKIFLHIWLNGNWTTVITVNKYENLCELTIYSFVFVALFLGQNYMGK